MNRCCGAIALVLLLSTVAGCGASIFGRDTVTPEISFSEVAKGTGMETPAGTAKILAVIRDEEQFNTVFFKIATGPPPEIDFRTHSVLLVQMGTCKSAGYSIEVAELIDHEDYVEARVVSRVPGRSCLNALALTRPYQFVKFLRTDKEIVFSETIVVTECE